MANTNDPFTMSDNIFERIETHLEAARSELDSFVDDARAVVDQRSGAWQETERGEAVLDWIDQLQDRADEISAFARELLRAPE
ncbi:hypothetical protein [Mycolicibacterium cosmeticum]|uniref:hypothetical protein n=1 Tax=Mycolicibacterium cosmeticum TaxID=258533 RepID=UPI003204CE8D